MRETTCTQKPLLILKIPAGENNLRVESPTIGVLVTMNERSFWLSLVAVVVAAMKMTPRAMVVAQR